MQLIKTDFNELVEIKNFEFADERGKFVKLLNLDFFRNNNLDYYFKESFFSISYKNVIRGMHFQIPPSAQTKLVSVLNGSILDVVLDLRKHEKTFGKYYCVELSDKNNKSLYIPKGFAHGFKTLSETATVLYFVNETYSPNDDKGILWDSFGFDWQLDTPILSARDLSFPKFKEFISPF